MLTSRTNRASRRSRFCRLETLEDRLVLDASLLMDINTVPVAAGSYPRWFTGVGGEVVFVTSDIFGDEVWKTDGQNAEQVVDFDDDFFVTPSDTFSGLVRKVENLFPWEAGIGIETPVGNFFDDGSEVLEFTRQMIRGDAGGWKYNIRQNGNETARLVRVDPQGETLLLGYVLPGWPSGPGTADHAVLNGHVLISHNNQLGISDGTVTGSMVLADSVRPHGFQVVGERVFYFSRQGNGYELWVTDGTASGTRLVKTLIDFTFEGSAAPFVRETFATSDHFYFVLRSLEDGPFELWRSDCTDAGTLALTQTATSGVLQPPVELGERVVFAELSEFSELVDETMFPLFGKLWISNGTAGGTEQATNDDVKLPTENRLTVVGDRAFFVVYTEELGSELWVTDGTTAGTRLLKDIYPGAIDSNPAGLRNYNGQLLFLAEDPQTGLELWTSDGTTDGTTLVRDINPGPTGSDPDEFVLFDNQLVFSAYTDTHGIEFWSTDGTSAGTNMLFDLAPGGSNATPNNLTVISERIYFSSEADNTGFEPWVTDGTLAGTHRIENIVPEHTDAAQPRELTVVGDHVFFTADDGIHGHELWITDGTAAGTRLVRDISAGPASADISEITAVGDKVYFVANDDVHGRELWVSDGTQDGTRLAADVLPGPIGSAPYHLTAAGDSIYFVAFDFDHGDELWISDGTEVGTHLIVDALPGDEDSLPRHLTYFDGQLYFVATSFNADFDEVRDDLWVTDGSAVGTHMVAAFSDPFAFEGSIYDPNFRWFTQLNDELYFLAFFQLWRIKDNQLSRIDDLDRGNQIHTFGWIVPTDQSLILFGGPRYRGSSKHFEYLPDQDKFRLFNSMDDELWPDRYFPQLEFQSDSFFIVFEESSGCCVQGQFGLNRLPRNGSQAYPIQVAEGQNPAAPIEPHFLDDAIYFAANHSELGIELWRGDGTLVGSSVFADIAPQGGDSHPSQLVQLGDAIILRADDNRTGSELWIIDLPTTKVEFTSADYDVNEDGSIRENEIVVRRTGPLEGELDFTVDFFPDTAFDESSTGSPDYVGAAVQYQFLPGESEIAISPPPIMQDMRPELDEKLRMRLAVDQPAFTTLNSQSWLTIVDDDRIPGDLSFDGELNREDLDRLVANIGLQWEVFFSAAVDLNSDLVLDVRDVQAWLEIAGPSLNPTGESFRMGDADLDGDVDAADWQDTFRTYGAYDPPYNPHPRAWSLVRDFNADGVNDSRDFDIWNENKFRDPPATPNRMPRVPRAPVGASFQISMAAAQRPTRHVASTYLFATQPDVGGVSVSTAANGLQFIRDTDRPLRRGRVVATAHENSVDRALGDEDLFDSLTDDWPWSRHSR